MGYLGGQGTVNVNSGGATVNAAKIVVGYKWKVAATDCVGTFNTSGSVTTTGEIDVGADGNQGLSGTQRSSWNQNAGQTTVGTQMILGEYDGTDTTGQTAGYGILNLDGGTFTTPLISTRSHYSSTIIGATNGTVNFDGGTLQALAS